jgi:hypothetical protein
MLRPDRNLPADRLVQQLSHPGRPVNQMPVDKQLPSLTDVEDVVVRLECGESDRQQSCRTRSRKALQ